MATAIVKACKSPSSPVQSSDCSSGDAISSSKAVLLRRSCLEDLKRQRGILSKEEFEAEKEHTLQMLRGLGK